MLTKKEKQLGMSLGKAYWKLRKMVLFDILKRHNENVCFRCGGKIRNQRELSIEHKLPRLDSDIRLFWDLNNVAFSHLGCNSGAAKTRIAGHGLIRYRRDGCRCRICVSRHQKDLERLKRNARKARYWK